jgi:hypothetical protein
VTAAPPAIQELPFGFTWVQDEPMARASHALVADGRVWLVDPVDGPGVDERIRAAGEPAGVIMLLGRHSRDAAAFAARLGVGVHELEAPPPFETIRLRTPMGRESALWWPERRVLGCADALGTVGYFRAPGDRIAVHPFLRLTPPRALAQLDAERVLVGHGEGVHERAAAAVRESIGTARRRVPSLALEQARRTVGHLRRRVR